MILRSQWIRYLRYQAPPRPRANGRVCQTSFGQLRQPAGILNASTSLVASPDQLGIQWGPSAQGEGDLVSHPKQGQS